MSSLRLHGHAVSNYVCAVRSTLLEKQLAHEQIAIGGSQDADFLAMNPMGKIPVLEDGEFRLGETIAILEYLEDRYPAVPLRPTDATARARDRQIMNIVQIYVEAPARSLFPGVFMGGHNAPETRSAVRAMLDRATAALARLMQPKPFLYGTRPGIADIFSFHHLDIVDRLGRFLWQRSIIGEIGLADWHRHMRERPLIAQVVGEFEADLARYTAAHGAAYSPAASAMADG